MAREWLLRDVDPEELKNDPKPQTPQTPQSKWENFWYHHKWTFWGCAFLGVALVVMVVQLCTRNTPDYSVLLLTEKTYLSNDLEILENTLAQYGEDLDGDGTVEVSIQNCMLGEQVQQQYNSSVQMFQAHLMAGDVLFFVWDTKTFEKQMPSIDDLIEGDQTFLAELPAAEGVTEDGTVYNWKDHPDRLAMEELFPASDPEKLLFPEELYFTVRNPVGTAEDSQTLYQQSMSLLENLIKQKKTAE